ncbi:hypothetical protein [Seonamhaeicola sp. ML3]|uniref:hypothetical protein n=1 Tax=Seonamhaeicola sp. ML3 TaxID=2937786 RepID=UPI00201070F2|nr:hypothetical protein [Seonamhaeicola sp. ML3]
MNPQTVFYKESGIAPPINLSLYFICSSIVILIFSFFYSLIITFLPIIYFNFLIVIAYGFIVSFVSRGFKAIFKIRNRKLSITATIILAVLAVYFQWVCYLFIVSFEDFKPGLLISEFGFFINILGRPDLVIEYITDINKIGLWSLGLSNPIPLTGIALWLVWLAEAAITIYVSWNNFQNFNEIPFSEKDNKWFKKETLDFDFERIPFKKNFIEDFTGNPSDTLINLGKGDGLRHAKVSIFSSDTEPKSLITVDNIVVTQRGKGKRDVTKVLEYCYVDNMHLMKIKDNFRIKKSSLFDY